MIIIPAMQMYPDASDEMTRARNWAKEWK